MPNDPADSERRNGSATWQAVYAKIIKAQDELQTAINEQDAAWQNATDEAQALRHKNMGDALNLEKDNLAEFEKTWVQLGVFSKKEEQTLSGITKNLKDAVKRNKEIAATLGKVNTVIGLLTDGGNLIRGALPGT